MITRIRNTVFIPFLTLSIAAGLHSCTKETSQSSTTSQTSSSTIAIASSENSSASGDSIYIVQPCPRGYSRDSIAETDLPSAATAYLTDNYSGYTFSKAFAVKNSWGQTAAFVAIIYYNDRPVALLFDSTGNSVRVLEQRERGDLDGKGWHNGGRFCDRDGLQRDTVALSALPSSILIYMATNYPTDTLLKAFQDRGDSSIAILSKNNGLFATIFDASGDFVKRVSLPSPPGICVSISETSLPANGLTYLSSTYPNYVFEKAFAAYDSNNTLLGYLVVINANNTRYAIRFDASGNFVSAKTIG